MHEEAVADELFGESPPSKSAVKEETPGRDIS
jgi:hypothetical protein